MLKQKYDRLASTNKSTGDPSCTVEVRKAKRISRAILAKAQSSALGGADASDGEDEEVIDKTSRVGARVGRRAPGTGGIREELTRV